MIIDYYDTSALLSLGTLPTDGYVSHFVISELEEIKTSFNKDENIKMKARQVSRALLSSNLKTFNVDLRKVEKIVKRHSWLPNNMDGRIIAEALYLKESKRADICFWTSDYNMYLFIQKKFYVNFVDEQTDAKEPWTGWGKYYPTVEQMALLYADPKMNVLNAKVNEYCEIFENNNLSDILKWTGEEYKHLDYKQITSAVGQKWKPLNTEQKMLFDLLQDDSIPVKLALGNFGSGKTSVMLSHALDSVQRGKFDKIVFVRNNVEVKDTVPLGALPNDEISKLMPFLMPICDHVGHFTFEDMLEQNVIEACHLGFIRGRDFKNTILFVDEAENLTDRQIQLLIGRIGKGSMLYLAGDLRQCDRSAFQKSSGIRKMIDCLQGNKLFGMVKLQQSVRSEVCKLADLMD